MNSLEVIFGELGITQYLDAFIDQGFDSWDTILDITESDLDALGVKLGHRRKLQRRIANYRGVAPETSLVSPTCTSIEDARVESNRTESIKSEKSDGTTVAKRKYRRHPKPDENAPERPPSAYVLFSNKMREDLKGQNLTFTEIAKLVGENWQNLNRDEKEPFERQAHEAKERYNRELAEYKKTTEYRKYYDYLHEFRKRQATQLQEKDVSKRLKLDSDSIRGSSTSGGSAGASGTTSGTVSGSDSQPGSEPPPTRQQRLGSSTSTIDTGGRVDYRAPLPVTTLLTIQAVDPHGATANGFMENHPCFARLLESWSKQYIRPYFEILWIRIKFDVATAIFENRAVLNR
ncbi:FACT complex subunit SSRP1 [Daldinia childiae]|uniref:FACT complex subunit SSRP1 n=1 Tax=Daldinia childiae TaxID=326645 RepID=UPI001445A212|nr:FACT complex subunit SSRP1 [Daldinia childiae]KAF3055923.1 FACT complex subunit SSRP1 [Daldinia childiae]